MGAPLVETLHPSVFAQIRKVLRRFGVDEAMRDRGGTTLGDALDEASAGLLIGALCDIDCCCRCCDEHRDVLTHLAGGRVDVKGD